MTTFFVETHAFDQREGQWHALTSCTTAETPAKAHETVKRALTTKPNKYWPIVLVGIEPR